MLTPDIIKEIMTSIREDYCFLVNHLTVILMMLVLMYMDDDRSRRLLKPLLLGLILLIYPFHASYISTTWDFETYRLFLNFLSVPMIVAYTVYCASKKSDKKPWLVITIGVAVFIVACSFDQWTTEQFVWCNDSGVDSSMEVSQLLDVFRI